MFDAPCHQKNDQHTLGSSQVPLDPQPITLSMRHPNSYIMFQIMIPYTCFLSNFTTSVIFRIMRSKAKIFKFDVNLSLIKRDDFFRANMSNFTFYTEHAGEE